MDASFWIKAWSEGRTNFHQETYQEKLTEYFPKFNPQKGQSVLVPLCGKTKDLLWLRNLGLNVQGVELSEQAVEAFFSENKLSFKKQQDSHFSHYQFENIVISCGDFFELDKKNTFDFVYDRASLVALPREMRKNYAQVIKQSLKIGGKYLLIVYEYDQAQLEGPPFSLETNEIHELFQDQFSITLMESKPSIQEGPRLSSLESLKQVVYVMEKVS